MIAEVSTDVSRASLSDEGIVRWRYFPGAVVTVAEANDEVEIISGMVREHWHQPVGLCIDIRGIRKVTREARQLFASDHARSAYQVEIVGAAIVVHSFVSKTIGNFFMQVNRPPHPTRLFTDDEAAATWIQARLGG